MDTEHLRETDGPMEVTRERWGLRQKHAVLPCFLAPATSRAGTPAGDASQGHQPGTPAGDTSQGCKPGMPAGCLDFSV
jgi:hypothetical protein